MCDLVMRIRNKDVYAFESKDRIADQAFSTLLNKSNSIFLFDTNSLNTNQIETLIRHHKQLELNQNRCFIFSQINSLEKFAETQGENFHKQLDLPELPNYDDLIGLNDDYEEDEKEENINLSNEKMKMKN